MHIEKEKLRHLKQKERSFVINLVFQTEISGVL